MVHDDDDGRPPDDRIWDVDPNNNWPPPEDDPWERDEYGRPIRKKKKKKGT
ncbi:hypothetical protein [Dactylosporangium sp. NPDC000521]|uniref:hypothetical protein n=1 Tax=Dactylosporangium sp. NPDC000521 TaxID=3363975 RepID=UPI0036A1B362